jgi:phosphate transport system substrate-binding protein
MKKMELRKISKKLAKNAYAVSPVIATLMLVLVAVGAAGAFYAWQSGWQEDMTGNVGSAKGYTEADVIIGGSSTVYEFTAEAVPEFEDEYNGKYTVAYESGGSGAGIMAAGEGLVDVGAASKFPSDEDMTNYPDLQIHTVAWDAVVLVLDADNDQGLTDINTTVLQALYYTNGGATDNSWMTADAIAWMANNPPSGANGDYTWADLGGTGTNPTNEIEIYDRSTKSGTEEVFGKQLLQCGKSEIEDVGITTDHSFEGNQGLIEHIAGNPDGFGFTSYGMAGATSEIVDLQYNNITASESSIMLPDDDPNRYEGGRPINYLTNGDPIGVSKLFLDFCVRTDTNQDLAEAAGYISIYA